MSLHQPSPQDDNAQGPEPRDLPPLGLRDLLRAGLIVFRSRWATLTALSPSVLVPSVLLALLAMLVAAAFGIALGTPAAVVYASDAMRGALSTTALLLTLVAVPYVAGSAAVVVCASILDRDCAPSDALRIALRKRLPSLLAALMWAGLQFAVLAAPAGLRLLVPPHHEGSPTALGAVHLATAAVRILHLWLAVRLVAFPAVLVLEGAVYGSALSRSWRLTAGRWWHSFAVAASALVLSAVVCWAVMAPVASILGVGTGSREVRSLLALCVLAFLTFLSQGWYMTVLALLYVDLRARAEGLSTAQLQQELVTAGLPAHPSGSGTQ